MLPVHYENSAAGLLGLQAKLSSQRFDLYCINTYRLNYFVPKIHINEDGLMLNNRTTSLFNEKHLKRSSSKHS